MPAMRHLKAVSIVTFVSAFFAFLCAPMAMAAPRPHIYQRPALSKDLIAFGYADDLWVVSRAGGRATRSGHRDYSHLFA